MKRIKILPVVILLLWTPVYHVLAGDFSLNQSNDGFNYQAVVRDSDGNLIANSQVAIQFSIKSVTEDIWIESHLTATNAYGMVNVVIGTGTRIGGSTQEFNGINWNQSLALQVHVDSGQGLVDLGTFDFQSVPYANYASNGLSSDQSALLSSLNPKAEENVQADWAETDNVSDGFINNKPDIPSDINQLNDADGLLKGSTFDGVFSSLTGIPENLDTDATDDFSGDYNDLTNKPTIAKDVNELEDTDGLLAGSTFDGSYNSLTDLPINLDTDATDDFTGDYTDLANKPSIPSDVNELADADGKLFSGSYTDLSNVPANIDTDATDDFSGDYVDLANKPTIPSDLNELNDVEGKLFSGSYSDLTDVPANIDTDATDDFSGDYNDLANKPSIPSDVNELADADGKLFSGSYTDLSNVPANIDTDATDDFSGDYIDLANRPSIPSDVNELADADGKLFSGSYTDLSNVPANLDTDATDDFSGDYTDLANKPSIPSDVNELGDADGKLFSGSYTDLSNVPANIDTDATDDFSGSFMDLTDVPANLDTDSSDDFDGAFSSLTGVPTNLDTDASDDFSGSYTDLTNVPANLDIDATDDFSGDYSDLTNKPTIIGSLATHSATELNDITDAGSGIIISDAERSSFTNTAVAVTSKSANWDEAHTWGDHSAEDYLKVVTGANITDATIGNEDINGSAAISSSKLETTVVVAGEGNAQLLNDAGYLLAADQVVTKTGNLIQTGDTDDDFLYGSTQLDNIDGIGTDDGRIFFDKSKGAFRAGVASGDQWDETNIGDFSAVVGGAGNTASGLQSAVVGGLFNTATAERSISAGGYLNNATGAYSNVYGGLFNNATKNRSSVLGGESNTASGGFATVSGGYQNTASGAYSHASGLSNSAGSYGETVIGHYATVEAGQNAGGVTYTDRLFAIGNGLDNDSRSNALELNKQGDMKVAGGLEVNSTTEGFLPPRMTTAQRDAIASPAIGLTIFNTETVSLEFYTGKIWFSMGGCTPLATVPAGVTAAALKNNEAQVSFTPAGGESIFTVVSSPGGITEVGSSSPIVVSGLTAGVDYTFTVYSETDCGDSQPSSASAAITAYCALPPTNLNVTTNLGVATITFDPGSNETSFTAVSNPGNITVSGVSSPLVVSGLTLDTEYTFDVYSTEACGNSTTVTTSAVTPCGAVGQKPTGVSATLGIDGNSASVSFTPTNGETEFLVESHDGAFSQTVSASPANFTGLVMGVSYTFNVTAISSCGNSEKSDASNAVQTFFSSGVYEYSTQIGSNLSVPIISESNTISPLIPGATTTSNNAAANAITTALGYCAQLTERGHTDWFLPNYTEFRRTFSSTEDRDSFYSQMPNYVWTSTKQHIYYYRLVKSGYSYSSDPETGGTNDVVCMRRND